MLTDVGATRILSTQIPKTLNFISCLINVPVEDLHLLGSCGKQDESGDIDIAIDITKYDVATIVALLGATSGQFHTGNQIGSYLIPIEGERDTGKVQVDFMFVENVEWAKFAYFSAGDASQYKGVVRTLLLIGCAAAALVHGITTSHYVGDVLYFRCGLTFDLNEGLRTICQRRKQKRSTEGGEVYNKTLTPMTFDEAKDMYSDKMKSISAPYYNNDPTTVIKQILGHKIEGGLTPADVETAEQIINIIKTTFASTDAERIYKFTAQRAMPVKDKFNFPPEISKYFVDKDIS